MIKIIIWNIRGIGKAEKQKLLFNMCCEYKPDILVLLEPFVQFDASFLTRRFGFSSVFSNVNNKIWCFASYGVEIQVLQDNSQFLHTKISSGLLEEDICCTFVYAKCCRTLRRALWEDLCALPTHNFPWMVGGDFNTVLHIDENQGGVNNTLGSIEDFGDMIMESGLTDAGFEGSPFTWTNKRIWKRLDRVLYSKNWADRFNSIRVSHLARRLSDHHPLFIIAQKIEERCPSSFRFQNMWLRHHTFLNTV